MNTTTRFVSTFAALILCAALLSGCGVAQTDDSMAVMDYYEYLATTGGDVPEGQPMSLGAGDSLGVQVHAAEYHNGN